MLLAISLSSDLVLYNSEAPHLLEENKWSVSIPTKLLKAFIDAVLPTILHVITGSITSQKAWDISNEEHHFHLAIARYNPLQLLNLHLFLENHLSPEESLELKRMCFGCGHIYAIATFAVIHPIDSIPYKFIQSLSESSCMILLSNLSALGLPFGIFDYQIRADLVMENPFVVRKWGLIKIGIHNTN